MQIFGIEITFDIYYICFLIIIVCIAVALHGIKYVEHESFTDKDECRIIGTYVLERCGDDIKGYMKIPELDQKTTQKEVPKILPTYGSKKNCPFPLEPSDQGCQLKCPTSTFLLANPNIVCQHVLSGETVPQTDDKCPDGYRIDLAGCVKTLSSCPANYDSIEGACHERCPDGSTSEFVEVDVDHDGFVEKKNIRVCRAKPLAAKNQPVP